MKNWKLPFLCRVDSGWPLSDAYEISVILLIIQGAIALMGAIVSLHPPHTRNGKRVWVVLFVMATLLAMGLQWSDTHEQKRETDEQRTVLTNRLNEVLTNLAEAKSLMKSSRILHDEYVAFTDKVLKTPLLDSATRQKILQENSAKSQELSARLGNEEQREQGIREKLWNKKLAADEKREKRMDAVIKDYQEDRPMLLYLVNAFAEQLKTVAAAKQDIVVSDYQGLPDAPNDEQGFTSFATMTLQSNTSWQFQIAMHYTPSTRNLIIRGVGGRIMVNVDERKLPMRARRRLVLAPEGVDQEIKDLDGAYTKAIDDSVTELLISAKLQFSDKQDGKAPR